MALITHTPSREPPSPRSLPYSYQFIDPAPPRTPRGASPSNARPACAYAGASISTSAVLEARKELWETRAAARAHEATAARLANMGPPAAQSLYGLTALRPASARDMHRGWKGSSHLKPPAAPPVIKIKTAHPLAAKATMPFRGRPQQQELPRGIPRGMLRELTVGAGGAGGGTAGVAAGVARGLVYDSRGRVIDEVGRTVVDPKGFGASWRPSCTGFGQGYHGETVRTETTSTNLSVAACR